MGEATGSDQRPISGRPFKKGQSGNPGGRPKMDPKLRELAQSYTAEAIKGLAAIARSKRSPAAARVSAWSAVLDRAWGKPAQAMEHAGVDGGPIEVADVSALEAARRIAFVLAKGKQELAA